MTSAGILSSFARFSPAPSRWVFATQAGLVMAICVVGGALIGAPDAGLLASLGAFAALYGTSRRPIDRLRVVPGSVSRSSRRRRSVCC